MTPNGIPARRAVAYVLSGLGLPFILAAILTFSMVFLPRRGSPPLAHFRFDHPVAIASISLLASGLLLVLVGRWLFEAAKRHSGDGSASVEEDASHD